VLGRDEVKRWVRELGEMWTDEEVRLVRSCALEAITPDESGLMGQIGEMVSLFSTQHEGRGLSYDDFGQVMARGRIV
jgi:hypothetical protein